MAGGRAAGRGFIGDPNWPLNPRTPSSGFTNFPLSEDLLTLSLATQDMYAGVFVAEKTMTITNMTTFSRAAAGATPTLCRYGIYTLNAGGTTATLAASIASDTAIWAGSNSAYTKALQTSFSVTRGTTYVATVLCVTAASAPSVHARGSTSFPQGIVYDTIFGTGLRVGGKIASQADLPASFATNTISDSAGSPMPLIYFS